MAFYITIYVLDASDSNECFILENKIKINKNNNIYLFFERLI